MQREANNPESYKDVIRSVGAPNKTVANNATVLTGIKRTSISFRYCIETGLEIPHHQHQNYAEGIDGCFRLTVIKPLYHSFTTIILVLFKKNLKNHAGIYPNQY